MGCGSPRLTDQQNKQLSKRLQHSNKVGQVLNSMRKKPYQYIKLLEKDLNHFRKDRFITYQNGCNEIVYETVEGAPAWNEAIRFLKTQYLSNHLLVRNSVLCEAAARRANLYNSRESHAHTKQSKSPLKPLPPTSAHDIELQLKTITGSKVKPGEYAVIVGMDFKLKERNYVENALLGLVVDDGNSERSNRNIMFSDNYKYYGSFIMPTETHVVVVVYLASQSVSSSF